MDYFKSIDEFVTLNVKYVSDSSVVRHLFIKEYNERVINPLKPDGKTLLVMNIPPFVDHNCIRHLFKDCGKIVDILFESLSITSKSEANKPNCFDKIDETNGYKVCFVVFTAHPSVIKALNLSKRSEALTLKPESDEYIIGLKAMKQKYNKTIIRSKVLQNEIKNFMTDYDKRVEDEKLKAKESDGIPDADGWIKVDRHSKRKSLPNNYSNDEKIVEKHNKKRKKTSNDLNNFYSYKVKESKIENLMQLRNKFEDDKKKIALMKSQRKFRPL